MSKLLVTHAMEEKARVGKAICMLDFPCEAFLKLTTENPTRFRIDEKEFTLKLEEYNEFTRAGESDVMPHLYVDNLTGKVVSHEGRHRAASCINAGVFTMPVAIFMYSKSKGLMYYTYSEGMAQKIYLTYRDIPKELRGQFTATHVEIKDDWWVKDFWAAWNPKSVPADDRTSLQINASTVGPLIVGYGWESYSPAVEAQITFDCMQLKGIAPSGQLQVYLAPNTAESDRRLVARVLKRVGAETIDTCPENLSVFKVFVNDGQSEYQPPDSVFNTQAKVLRKLMRPDVAEMVLVKDDEHYPQLERYQWERPAPPGTLPQYKARPPANTQTILNLPGWAWNHM